MDNNGKNSNGLPASDFSSRFLTRQKNSVSEHLGHGNPSKIIANTLRGINHQSNGIPAPGNSNNVGLTFFTRPYLNLSYDNLAKSRRLSPLLTDDPNTFHYAIRMLLDGRRREIDSLTKTPLTDDKQAFIPVFTNLLTGLSGWPDETVDTFISDPGLRNEVYMLVDNLGSAFNSFELTANFRNIDGDPIMSILAAWTIYAKAVAIGSMEPFQEMAVSKTIDYQTRIYRLVLDKSRKWIQKIACCGAAFPYANPIGSSFNFALDQQRSSEVDDISVPFKCIGYEYNDPIIGQDFNRTVVYYNALMADKYREEKMIKLDGENVQAFNFNGYPRISDDMELEWWVPKDEYVSRIRSLSELPFS